jgi:hypothetical protein
MSAGHGARKLKGSSPTHVFGRVVGSATKSVVVKGGNRMIVSFKDFDTDQDRIGYVTGGDPDKGGLVKICTKPGEYYIIGASEVTKI